jgi:hypothetical protein
LAAVRTKSSAASISNFPPKSGRDATRNGIIDVARAEKEQDRIGVVASMDVANDKAEPT